MGPIAFIATTSPQKRSNKLRNNHIVRAGGNLGGYDARPCNFACSGVVDACGLQNWRYRIAWNLSMNAIYFALSALGIGALILTSATLFTIVKWIGAAYLIFTGHGMLKPLLARWISIANRSHDLPTSERPQRASRAVTWKSAYLKGRTMSASNPKNIAYFVAIVPQFIAPMAQLAFSLSSLATSRCCWSCQF